MRGPLFILLVSLIASAGAPCGCRRSRPASPPVFFSIEYKEKVDPLEYFPLAVGAKWTYASTDKTGVNGSSKSVVITKWITEHVITAEYDIPAGKVFLGKFILRDVQYDEPPDANETQLRWFRDTPPRGPAGLWTKDYLVAGNYVFDLFDYGWDAAAQGLSARYRDELPSATPELFFPLDGAHCWSDRVSEERDYQTALLAMAGKGPAPNPSTYYWIVRGREDVEVPYGKVRDAMKLTYTANCGTATEWFKEGLGFVKAGFSHGGSYGEWETTLVHYSSATAPE
ncbi:MAG: hypothetical protein M1376_05875 [Planctomycetes bacterium]|nr:hypothetical protein [Planctomycetota bacterium]